MAALLAQGYESPHSVKQRILNNYPSMDCGFVTVWFMLSFGHVYFPELNWAVFKSEIGT